MKKLLVILFVLTTISFAQKKDFGFGIIVGDPTGVTLKYWNSPKTAFVFDIGASYFGSPRISMDYVWHFDAFRSRIVDLFAGPGIAIGIGEGKGWYYTKHGDEFFVRKTGSTGVGIRGVLGINIIPRNTPLEIFFEGGVLIGVAPDFGSAFDAALGLRFYP